MPHRVQSEQTRQRRVRLARERQGVNGRWESNRAKAAARAAKRNTHRLGALFTAARSRQARAQQEVFTHARKRATELDSVGSVAMLLGIIGDLQKLPLTAKILWKLNLPKKLSAAGCKFPAAGFCVQRLVAKWRTSFREEMAKRQAVVAAPSLAVHKAAAQDKAARLSSASPAACAVSTGRSRRHSASSRSSRSSSSSSSSSSSAVEMLHAQTPPPAASGKTGQQEGDAWQQVDTPPQRRRPPPKQQKLMSFFKTQKTA